MGRKRPQLILAKGSPVTRSSATQSTLLDAARAVRDNAHAPYSGFKVGAALLCDDDHVHTGCNVENVAYPEGTCAEAGAIAAMCATGQSRSITAVLVVAHSDPPVTPCGGCRQKLAEFGAADVPVYLADLDGVKVQTTLGDMLPGAFSTQHLDPTS